jgi:hypothetical protein
MNTEQLQKLMDLLEAANLELSTLGKWIPDDDESDARQHYNNASAQVQEALGILNNS